MVRTCAWTGEVELPPEGGYPRLDSLHFGQGFFRASLVMQRAWVYQSLITVIATTELDPDLQAFANFTIPEKDEGFDEIKFVWQEESQSSSKASRIKHAPHACGVAEMCKLRQRVLAQVGAGDQAHHSYRGASGSPVAPLQSSNAV